jgi:hypothetical protein
MDKPFADVGHRRQHGSQGALDGNEFIDGLWRSVE